MSPGIHYRLASSLMAAQQQQPVPATSAANGSGEGETEIQSSIKEVTSAIVHYVNDQTNRSRQNQTQDRSRSSSPR